MLLRSIRPIVLSCTLAAFLGGCAAIPPPSAALNFTSAPELAPDRRAAHNARVYDQAARWIERRYYDASLNKLDWPAAVDRHRTAALDARDDEQLYAALNKLLAELGDEHTHALSPKEIELYQRRHSVLLGFRTGPAPGGAGHRRILAVFPGSPAELAGVRPGWILTSADGQRPGEVLGLGKLENEQLVRCDFLDATGTPLHLEIRARRLEYPPIRDARILAGDVLLLSFDTFDLPAARWVRAELKRHRPSGGVIIDLRDNVGGETRALAAILAEFFPVPANLGAIRSRTATQAQPRHTPNHLFGARYHGPLAVLVSEASASAAEILAAVVQHEKRGTIVGTKTSGNVLVCVRWPLPGGGQLQLSVYDYVGPDGQRLEKRGVTPDLVVEPNPGAAPDPQVEAALTTLRPIPPSRHTPSTRAPH